MSRARGDQRRARLDVALDERVNMDGMVARNGGQPDPTRECVEILGADLLRPLSSSRRPVAHFDGTDDNDLAGFIGVEVALGIAEWKLRLVDLDDPLERLALRVDH